MRLTSRAYLETPQNERPHLKLAWLPRRGRGLIALSGGPGGPLDTAIAAGQGALAAARCETLHRLYGDRLYIELQRHGMAAERLCEPALIELAYARGLPLVATNEPFFAAARRLRGPRCAVVHRRGPAHLRRRAPAAHGGASSENPRRNGRAVRRSAGGAGGDGRNRATLRLPPAHPRADPAAFFRRARRRPSRAGAGAAGGGRGTAPRRGGRAGAPPRAPSDRTRPQRRGLSRAAWRSSSASSRA